MTAHWTERLLDWRYAHQVAERLAANLVVEGDCWVWTKSLSSDGYGQISVKRAMIRVHQVAYAIYVGPVPDGLQIDHLCRNRACANPDHLEPVTSGVNSRRGLVAVTSWCARKTHCVAGHPFDQANTYVHPRTGYRWCRRCRADRMRRYTAA